VDPVVDVCSVHVSLSWSRSFRLRLHCAQTLKCAVKSVHHWRASKRASRNHERDSGSLPPTGESLTAANAAAFGTRRW
jgi:hypothetical protein